MVKLEFTNAVVEDHGYGLNVNGKSLEEMISVALGTRVGTKSGYGSGLPSFDSNSCDVTVIIDPHPSKAHIETDSEVWESVKEMEECKENGNNEEIAEADPEE